MPVCVTVCAVTAGCLQSEGKGMAFSELLRPSAFTGAKVLLPLPATGRMISGHDPSGKHLDNVFRKSYLNVHRQRSG